MDNNAITDNILQFLNAQASELLEQTDNGKREIAFYLTDLLTENELKTDKFGRVRVKSNWDIRKTSSVILSDFLSTGNTAQQRQAFRITQCANVVFFRWSDTEFKFVFSRAFFCRCRHCIICQWRLSMKWTARFLQAFPAIYLAYPTMRYLMLTLTAANCPLVDLRPTIDHMNKSFVRLSQLKSFPALGYIKALEVTKEKGLYDKKGKLIRKARPNYAHPHFHVLLAVPPAYFSRNYLSTEDWVQLWKKSLRVDYDPICHVRIVKPKKDLNPDFLGDSPEAVLRNGLQSAISEVFKYISKPEDIVNNKDWFLEMAEQVHKVRHITLGGIFKEFMNENEVEKETPETENNENDPVFRFSYEQPVKRYIHKHRSE